MGLLSFFTGRPLSPARLIKVAALASNAFAQPDVRMRELERLVKDGSPEALLGALKRLSINSQGHIADEDEKQWVEDAMVRAGEKAVLPLQAYIQKEKQLTYAVRALLRILGDGEGVARVLQLLGEMSPHNWQKSDAKLQLVWQVAPFVSRPEVFKLLLGYLNDHSDDVQWAVLEAVREPLADAASSEKTASEAITALAALVCDPATSTRIARRAATVLVESGFSLPKEAVIPQSLSEQFFVDKKQHLRQRAG